MAAAWLGKKECFESNLEDNDLEEVQFFARDEARGALAMTYRPPATNRPRDDGWGQRDPRHWRRVIDAERRRSL